MTTHKARAKRTKRLKTLREEVARLNGKLAIVTAENNAIRRRYQKILSDQRDGKIKWERERLEMIAARQVCPSCKQIMKSLGL